MNLDLSAFFIVCPMIFIAGMIGAIAGGGSLTAIPAYLFAGAPIHFALGTDKLSTLPGVIVAALRFYRNGYVNTRLLLPSAVATVLRAAAGVRGQLSVMLCVAKFSASFSAGAPPLTPSITTRSIIKSSIFFFWSIVVFCEHSPLV